MAARLAAEVARRRFPAVADATGHGRGPLAALLLQGPRPAAALLRRGPLAPAPLLRRGPLASAPLQGPLSSALLLRRGPLASAPLLRRGPLPAPLLPGPRPGPLLVKRSYCNENGKSSDKSAHEALERMGTGTLEGHGGLLMELQTYSRRLNQKVAMLFYVRVLFFGTVLAVLFYMPSHLMGMTQVTKSIKVNLEMAQRDLTKVQEENAATTLRIGELEQSLKARVGAEAESEAK
ncbi:hypothetical protein ACP4OV_022808 [Aristida adscensionis]